MTSLGLIIIVMLLGLPFCTPFVGGGGGSLDKLNLPPGYRVTYFEEYVPGARSMTLGEEGTLFVGTRNEGVVYALVDTNNDFRSDKKYVIAEDKYMPNGVVYRGGDLYVAEVNRILKYPDIEDHLKDPPSPVIIRDDLPDDKHHGWKYINFGPEGHLYVPVGAPCNICKRDDERYASILRMTAEGDSLEIFAEGIRNTVMLKLSTPINTIYKWIEKGVAKFNLKIYTYLYT